MPRSPASLSDNVPTSAANLAAIHLPGHNYFGHQGRPADEHPAVETDVIELIAGSGIKGDRFFDYKDGYKGQITFFDESVYEALCLELGVRDKTPGVFRRNVLASGVDLNTLIGREFEVQGVQFSGREECRPCYWMDTAFGPGAESAMRGRGGLRAQILSDGILRTQARESLAPRRDGA